MNLLAAFCRGLSKAANELGLPHDEREAGVFVAGMAWAFVVYVGLLIVVSWLTARTFGLPL